jgi:hypothetical protein
VSLGLGGSQQFVATVVGTSNISVTWGLSGAGSSTVSAATASGLGTIDARGNYVAPANISAEITVEVTGTSVADPSQSASAVVTINAAGIVVVPATATVQAGVQQAFTANTTGLSATSLQWRVNGQAGGGPIWGTISPHGIYTAPAIDPGAMVTVSAADTANDNIAGNAGVTVVNPPTPPLVGATYAQARDSWNAVLLPWAEELSGLTWDPNDRTWDSAPNWTAPASGIGPQIYYLEMALRPATRLAIARQDIALMEELAEFHLTLLQWRATTVGAMLRYGGNNAMDYIEGPPTARTFAWYDTDGDTTTIIVREDVLSDAQYLSTAAQLLRAIAQMPAAKRTAPLLQFVQGYSGFLASEQLLRILYGTKPDWFGGDPNIPLPLVAGWTYLAQTGYRPPPTTTYSAAMTDTMLWLVADSAEVLGADAAAPNLAILNNTTRPRLQQAALAGGSLMQARCPHRVAPDGADVLSLFAGDYDYHPAYDYAGDTGPNPPTVPNPMYGLSWDISHSYRFPIIFRSLYETRNATGASFPTLNDLVALGNSYFHLAFTGNAQLPVFNNYVDGWNGWVNWDPSSLFGYPPEQYCDATQSPNDCLTPGAMQGWGQLSFANPSLATLMQNLVNLAYDDSAADQSFIDQHYYYGGPYNVVDDTYPWLMIWVAGDNAERLQ